MQPTGGRVVLLDRDGTIVVDRDYLADPAGLEFLPGAIEGLLRLHQSGHRLIVISNQSGVGRGLFSLGQLQAVNARLVTMVREIGAELAGIYCCPHRPEDGCSCRKPAIGLVEQAVAQLQFDPSAAIVIGDKTSDMELGRRIGAVTIRIAAEAARGPREVAGAMGSIPGSTSVAGSNAIPSSDANARGPHYVAADLLRAALIIERL